MPGGGGLSATIRTFLDRYVPNKSFYLSESDRARPHEAGGPDRAPLPAGTYARRILERLLVDLSWASSRMEGNTYSILETERLLQFGEEATGKDRKEAVMILNQKEAIQYVVDNLASIAVSRADICNLGEDADGRSNAELVLSPTRSRGGLPRFLVLREGVDKGGSMGGALLAKMPSAASVCLFGDSILAGAHKLDAPTAF
jgi:hypothetical protein